MGSFWKGARKSFDGIMGKTNKAIESGRLQIDITQYKNNVNATYREIGKYVHQQSKEGKTEIKMEDEFLLGKLKDIAFFNEKIEELKEKSKQLFREAQKK